MDSLTKISMNWKRIKELGGFRGLFLTSLYSVAVMLKSMSESLIEEPSTKLGH
jgi:hypothetical protein